MLAELVADDLALLLTERFETGAGIDEDATMSALRPRPLPVAPTRLVGREHDLAEVCGLIEREDVRLLTLCGLGGVGKTRLALAAADGLRERFPDGVGFADLSSVRSSELVPGAVAVAIGVLREGTRPVAELLLERLADARVLLVLDNFEHVLAAAPFVSELLAGCRGIKVIVTSRALLRLRGEREVPVTPLEVPAHDGRAVTSDALGAASVRLFVERAHDHQLQFAVEPANAQAVVELCRRLEGIPLAIELAAARVRVLPPSALLNRVGDRLDLLSGPSDLPERQRTLRATIDWSYELLSVEERELFAALSVFVGGFTLASAQAVCGGETDVIERVSSLIDQSLVVAQERPGREPRFRMLETVREYAQDRLERDGREQETRLEMARYFARVAEQAADGLMRSEQSGWLAELDAEVDNLRAAITWTFENDEPDLFLRIADLPWTFWWLRGYVAELRPLAERSLERHLSLEPDSRALQLHLASSVRAVTGDSEGAIALLLQLIELQRARGDEQGLAVAQWMYSAISQRESVGELRAMLTEAAAALRPLSVPWIASIVLMTLAMYALLEGEASEAERLGEEALELARAIDSEHALSNALWPLGYAALACGEVGLARTRFAHSAEASRHIQDREGISYALDGLAAVALAKGKPELAARAIGTADATREQIGVSVYPVMQQTYRGPFVSAVQAALGATAFEAARSAGTDTDPHQAIEELIELTA